ncbi:hypothetical protein Q3G72_028629 [Acer saccharum]|nr:hypothetical protein Q3G72_028629 [Acer saccharum]
MTAKGRKISKQKELKASLFWRNRVTAVASEYPDVELSHIYVDNVAMQLVCNPKQLCQGARMCHEVGMDINEGSKRSVNLTQLVQKGKVVAAVNSPPKKAKDGARLFFDRRRVVWSKAESGDDMCPLRFDFGVVLGQKVECGKKVHVSFSQKGDGGSDLGKVLVAVNSLPKKAKDVARMFLEKRSLIWAKAGNEEYVCPLFSDSGLVLGQQLESLVCSDFGPNMDSHSLAVGGPNEGFSNVSTVGKSNPLKDNDSFDGNSLKAAGVVQEWVQRGLYATKDPW